MKNIKRILAIVFCLIICFSLCSCNYIDELRSKQAFYDESGNITFRDEVYKILPSSEYLKYYWSAFGNLTAKDVPVLLSENYKESFSYNNDLSLLSIPGTEEYYVREDLYDEYYELVENMPKLDRYCIMGHRSDDKREVHEKFEVLLSKEATLKINESKDGEKVTISDYWRGVVTLKITDDEIRFLKESYMRIIKIDGKMYLETSGNDEEAYLIDESAYDELNKFFSYEKDSSVYYY